MRRDLSAWWQVGLIFAPLFLLSALGVRGLQLSKRTALEDARAQCERLVAEISDRFHAGVAELAVTLPQSYSETPIPTPSDEPQELFRVAMTLPAADAAPRLRRLEETYPEARSESGLPLLPLIAWVELRNAATTLGQRVFQRKGEDGATRTLGEFLMQSYLTGEMVVPLPEFAKISIYRLKGESGEEEKLTIDFTKAIAAATEKSPAKEARALDVPLQWGDIIEIQQALGSTEQWRGFTPQTLLYLKKALTRFFVDVWINGAKKGELSLEPEIPTFVQAGSERRVPTGRFSPFTVSEIARRANVQLEELVKVTLRSGENVREFTPEQLRAIDPWVEHGDRIEIERL